MHVIKGDKCKKRINSTRETTEARIGYEIHVELCERCGKKIYDVLVEMNVLPESNKKKFSK